MINTTINMNQNKILFLIILTIVVFGTFTCFVCANDNITSNNNTTNINHTDTVPIQSYNQDNSNINTNNTTINENISSTIKDDATVNYLVKNKEKFDDIVKKSTKKDRTFKLGKYGSVIIFIILMALH